MRWRTWAWRTHALTKVATCGFASRFVNVESVRTQAYWQAFCSISIETKWGCNREANVSLIFWAWLDGLLSLLPFSSSVGTPDPRARYWVKFLFVQFALPFLFWAPIMNKKWWLGQVSWAYEPLNKTPSWTSGVIGGTNASRRANWLTSNI